MKLLKSSGCALIFISAVFTNTSVFAACDQTILNAAQQGFEYVSFHHAASAEEIKKRRSAGITPAAIDHAQYLQNVFGVITKPTPFYSNEHINQFAKKLLGHNIHIYMKDETIHPTGSFKDRMPIRFYDKVLTAVRQNAQHRGDPINLKVVAVSTGNQGRAVAYAANRANAYLKQQGLAHQFNITAEITMSADALPHKKAAIAQLGAKIRDHYPDHQQQSIPSYDAAEDLVLQEARSDAEHVLLLPHADTNSINGYAVIATEMMKQAKNHHINLAKIKPGEVLMLVPLGSGGILSGTEEISARYPNVYSIGVTAPPADMTYRSLKQCHMIRATEPYDGQLIVDGVMATPEAYSLDRIREIAKGVALVNQQDAVYATGLLKKYGIHVEPTSALPLAALLLGMGNDFAHVQYAFIVLTGKNISPQMEAEITRLSKMDEISIHAYFAERRAEIAKSGRIHI